MFVYHGKVDQASADGVESVVVILARRIHVGSSCIVLLQRKIDDARLRDEVGRPSGPHESFATTIESADIAPDGETANFICDGPYSLKLKLPVNMETLDLSFELEGKKQLLASSMGLIMRCQPVEEEQTIAHPVEYDAAIFTGFIFADNKPQESAIAFVLYEKQNDDARQPVNACLVWNSQPLIAELAPDSNLSGGGDNDDEKEKLHFTLSNQSHEFRGALEKGSDLSLELSLRPRQDPPNAAEWKAVRGLELLNEHRETLTNMVAELASSAGTEIHNDTHQVVHCTLENSPEQGAKYNKVVASIGIGIAYAGVLSILCPAGVGAVVGIIGLVLAAQSVKDTFDDQPTYKSMTLFYGDSMKRVPPSGWSGSNNDIVVWRVYIDGNYLKMSSYRVKKAENRIYDLSDVLYGNSYLEKEYFSLYLGTRKEIEIGRILSVPGLQATSSIRGSGSATEYPDEAAVWTFDKDANFQKEYPASIWSESDGTELFQCAEGSMVIFQRDRTVFGPTDLIMVDNFLSDPFTPVLILKHVNIYYHNHGGEGEPGYLIDSGSFSETQVLKKIQNYLGRRESKDNCWGYVHNRGRSDLWAMPRNGSLVLQQNTTCDTYFVVDHGSWKPRMRLK